MCYCKLPLYGGSIENVQSTGKFTDQTRNLTFCWLKLLLFLKFKKYGNCLIMFQNLTNPQHLCPMREHFVRTSISFFYEIFQISNSKLLFCLIIQHNWPSDILITCSFLDICLSWHRQESPAQSPESPGIPDSRSSPSPALLWRCVWPATALQPRTTGRINQSNKTLLWTIGLHFCSGTSKQIPVPVRIIF
jgi:hypothetical protein